MSTEKFKLNHIEIFNNCQVIYDKETHYLSINDKDANQLALLYVQEED